ncbi:MAG: toxin-antitoxin system HicB family antitoxin [Spirochaetes bacterium]|jgi:predicted DNA-binding protein|nr:toxin-antitoxin system HicB family antitoxin [Spirochaetota bacterium]
MAGKNTLTIRVPEELKDRIETLAAQQGISINQFAMYAFAKQIQELEAGTEIRKSLRGIDRKQLFRRMDEILDRVPDRDVPEWDRTVPE